MKKQINSTICNIYLVLMLFAFPLFMRNGYYDVLRSKRLLNYILTIAFVVILGMVFLLTKEKSLQDDFKSIYLFTGIYAIALVAGMAFAQDKALVFLGKGGRCYGVVCVLMWLVVMIALSKYVKWNAVLSWSFLLGCNGVYVLQILNNWKIDPLRAYVGLTEGQMFSFSSTIGNINFNATFDCITMAVLAACFFVYKELFSKIVFGSSIFLGFMGMFCCRSLSVYLGIGAILLVLFGFALYKMYYLLDFGTLFALFTLATILMRMLYYGIGDMYSLESMTEYLMTVPVMIALILISVMLLCLGYFGRSKHWRSKRAFWIYVITIAGGSLAALIGFCILVMQGKIVVDLDWGTGRVYAWNRSLMVYKEFPFMEKLAGCGTNGLGPVLRDFCYDEMIERYKKCFIDAHNEYIQSLLTNGILGFVGYFGIMISELVYAVRMLCSNREDRDRAIIIICGIMAFMAQGIANNPTIATTPFVFIGLGVFWNILREKKRR
ncbi:MAG: O-antigen ligase family protein [Lachnospiraceae bacterium]|nr:O-antigen ligase family protein [Lachnospiraceae bacterium]